METVDNEADISKDARSSSDEEKYDETDHCTPVDSVSLEQLKKQSLDTSVSNGVLKSVWSDGKLMSETDPERDVGEAEDGEILEDGEIDDEDEDDGEELAETVNQEQEGNKDTTSPQTIEGPDKETLEPERSDVQKPPESESEGDEEEFPREKRKKDKKRRKRQREKDKKKKSKDDSKRKRKRHDYVDFDKAEGEYDYQPKMRRRSPPGPYDSPYQSPEEKGKRSPPGPYDSPYRSPPGPYDSPPESPPGPYDSPPEDSDEDDRYGDQNNHRKRAKKSMMGMIDDAYLDPNIAASEKQDIFQGSVRGRNRGKGKPMKGMPPQPKKKPLLDTPRAARPLCKFYKEGKCAKGTQCPFNHDFTPPKKPEICKFYLNSSCNKGQDCIYMHGEYPCKFFHTGAQCFGGDNCKFSHDPLTAETYPLLTKILDNDEDDFKDFQPKAPKPSLLGSPPRHVKEAAERMKGNLNPSKKIPSLLDIEVFPPKQSPTKQQNSPNAESASPKPGSMHCRPGFYSESAPQTGYINPAVQALGVLLNKAANQSPSGRYSFQSPNNQGFAGGDGQQIGSQDTEESEVDNSQDTQKLEDESSQEDMLGIKTEEGFGEDDKKQSNFEVPSHLPPKQRELFMRIHQQQREETIKEEKKKDADEPVDDDDWYSSDEDEGGQSKPNLVEMLKNINKQNVQKTQHNSAPQPQSQPEEQTQSQPKLSDSSSGSFNILQMLNAIRGQSSTSTETQGSVPSASHLIDSLLPQSAKEAFVKTEPSVKVEKTPPHRSPSYDPMEQLPKVPKDGSDLPYKVLTMSVRKTLYVPPNLDMSDPRVSNDPRVQKYPSRGVVVKLERQTSNKSSSDSEVNTETKVPDPRSQPSGSGDNTVSSVNSADPRKRVSAKSDSPSDPRRASKDSSVNTADDLLKTADPRLQRAMTELIQSAVASKQDPRLQKSQSNPPIGMHSLPVRPPIRHGYPMAFAGPPPGVRPMGPGPHRPPGMPMGPRSGRPPLLRTPIMPDNSFRPRGPRPFSDLRMNRQNSNEMHYGPPQGGPRARPPGMSPGRDHVQNFGPSPNDPRTRAMGPGGNQPGPPPNDPRLRGGIAQNSETANFPQTSSDPRLRPQGQSIDTKNQAVRFTDPRLERQGGSLDISSGPRISDPRLHRQTSQPAMPSSTVRHVEGQVDNNWDNRPLSRLDPRSQNRSEPESGQNTDSKTESVDIKKRKFIGQRKGSMEYSSPLGMSSDQPDPAVSGFSSYGRLPGNRPQSINSKPRPSDLSSGGSQDMNLAPSQPLDPRSKAASYGNSPSYSDYSSPVPHEQGLGDEGRINLPPALQPPLKDLFKTIDPTASPFC